MWPFFFPADQLNRLDWRDDGDALVLIAKVEQMAVAGDGGSVATDGGGFFPRYRRRYANDPDLAHALRIIPEFGYRVLRVIYNHTRQPVHVVTVYFDRTMKGKL